MHKALRIDRQRPMSISGSVTRDLSKMSHDPMHVIAMDLAQSQMNPAFLRLSDPVDEANIEVSASDFLSWLNGHPVWSETFYMHLQSLAQTAAGEPLLTTWLTAKQFWSMLADGKGSSIIDEIDRRVRDWKALGLDEVYLEVFELGLKSESAKRKEVTAPVAA